MSINSNCNNRIQVKKSVVSTTANRFEDKLTKTIVIISMVFEGPYKDVKKWYNQTIDNANQYGKNVIEVYFFYTTCPKCAKHYGKNYVISLAKIV